MRAFILIIYVSITLTGRAQLYPLNNSVLNHLQVMFEYPALKKADCYKIQITGKTSSFDKSLLYQASDSCSAHLVTGVLKFGNAYKWRVIAYSGGKNISTSPEYFFETVKTNLETIFRANVSVYDSTKTQKGFIFLDHGVVIDRKGNLVLVSDSFGVEKRDFSLTSSGSITYVQGSKAFDRSLNGNVIWQSSKLTKDNALVYGYHHDITKLKNGNYLVMCKIREKDTLHFRKNLDEGIVEMDVKNNIKWLWKENDHISDTAKIKTTHLNSIFQDDKENKIYVSSRDMNTIFTINRSNGKIEKCIGYKLANGAEHFPQAWFAGQHSAQLLESGNILLFNNNARRPQPGAPSSILEINNPTKKNPEVSASFFYIYDFERGENHCAKGGDVNKLKNGNYIISSSAFNLNFEINANSEIVWKCQPEKYDSTNKNGIGLGSYRINFEESLYPSFFTLDPVYESGKLSGFKITNKGSSNDEYRITFKTAGGKTKEENKTAISSGKNQKFKLPVKPNIRKVMVEAVSNPGKSKEININ